MKTPLHVARLFVFALLGFGAMSTSLTHGTSVEAATFTPETLPLARVGTVYSMDLTSSEATSSALIWDVTNGSLPPDLHLEARNNGQSARIQGWPTTAGTYPFHLQLLSGTQVVHDQAYNLFVLGLNESMTETLMLPHAQVGTTFSYSFPTTSGTSPFTWMLTSGTLPSGLSLSPSGMITGTPMGVSSTAFTVQTTDALGIIRSYPLNLWVDPSNFSVTNDTLPNATVGSSYTTQLTSSGTSTPLTWTLTAGALPSGLTLDSQGRLQGNPITAGSYPLTFQVRDANGQMSDRSFVLTVNGMGSSSSTSSLPVITSLNFGPGTVGTLYSYTLGASSGTAPYQWRVVNGTLPLGLQLGSNGMVTGTPTLAGRYTFSLEATDAQNQHVTVPYEVTIQPNDVTTSAELTARLQTLSNLGMSTQSLIKLADDRNPNTQEDSAVYYIGTDGRRHAFPNERIFLTWYGNFLNVHTVSASNLASIPLGSNVTYKPGARMIKFPSDTRVYVLSGNRTLRWIPSESLAQSLYGTNWNQQVDDVSSAYMNDYTFGTDLASSNDYSPSSMQSSMSTISETLPVL